MTASSARVIDRKLAFHVRKYLDLRGSLDSKVKEEDLYDHLTTTYLEYQRKPQGPFRKIVGQALEEYTKTKSSIPRKRALDASGDNKLESLQRKQDIVHSANLLNANILKTYAETRNENEGSNEGQATTTVSKRKKPALDRVMENDRTKFGVERPVTRYSDMGGIENIISEIRELIEYPLIHPEIYNHLGVEPPRGILLHGPPGTGKTMLASAIAGETGVYFIPISAPEIVSGVSGGAEEKLRALFDEAVSNAPSMIFIDEIDVITPKREESQRGMDKRIVAQLLTCADSLSLDHTNGKPVLLVGATNRPDSLDSALRRAGRFDREICVSIPDDDVRCHILRVLCKKMNLSKKFDFNEIAKRTPGFVGADLMSLTKEAAVVAVNRVFSRFLEQERNTLSMSTNDKNHKPFNEDQLQGLCIEMDDFFEAITKVQPCSRREGFSTVPDSTWQDVGGLKEIREELLISIVHPIRFPERFIALGLEMPAGVLLYGPPGCGKTMLAKAVANESRANFISIKGPELLDKYVGESEKAVRQLFQRANSSAPCIIFFDELDALCPRRGNGNHVSERVVNQLLTEMDGLESRRSVFVIAATNRPDMIDPAMLRPGRLDKLLYVALPSSEDRCSILRTVSKKTPLANGVNLDTIACDKRCEGYSGADLAALVREACIFALKSFNDSIVDSIADNSVAVTTSHFNQALDVILPSVSQSDQKTYDRLKQKLRKSRFSLNPVGVNQVENSTNEIN